MPHANAALLMGSQQPATLSAIIDTVTSASLCCLLLTLLLFELGHPSLSLPHTPIRFLNNSSHAFVYVAFTGKSHCLLQARLQMHTGDAVKGKHTYLML